MWTNNTEEVARRKEQSPECIVLYVDLLGFGKLTEDYPYHLVYSHHGGIESSSSSETFNTYNRFHRILDQSVSAHQLIGSVRAMLFSDCAFLDFGGSLLTVLAAAELMKNLILEKIPARMGLGRGTFYPFYFSTEITDSSVISRSRFIGTAVVRAHAAERCGGKGLRIFLHPELKDELSVFQQRIRALSLPSEYKDAKWELDFLYEQRPAAQKPSADEADHHLFRAVQEMEKQIMSPDARVHYTETISAMNRMRKANTRSIISD